MGYDPQTNKLNEITSVKILDEFREHRPQFLFSVGEEVTVKGVVFRVHDIGESRLVLKPIKAS